MNKKIVMIVPYFPRISETFIVNKFLGLLNAGWDVHVLCEKREKSLGQYYPQLEDEKIRIEKRIHTHWPTKYKSLAVFLMPAALIDCIFHNPKGTYWYFLRGFRQFGWKIVKQFYLDSKFIALKSDILHFEFGSLAVEEMHLKNILNIHISVSFRGYDLNHVGFEQEDFYKSVWENVDRIHFLGKSLWEKATQRGFLDDKPYSFIPPAIDVNFFDFKRDEECETLHLLSIGRLEWKKGYEYILQAIQKLKTENRSVKYRIVGDGSYLEALTFARYQLGLEKEVEFVGSQSKEQIREHMKWANIFLHGAVSEGFCNAVVEAQASGLPVICSDAGGLSENIEDGVTGFVIPRRNAKKMSGKIKTLADNSNLRKKMGLEGQKRAQKYFNLALQEKSFHQFYQNFYVA